ncbi:MAG: hypothetical protein IT513_15410 [Burkholderiales bacterium]|nr:hypothetical protein [Burkholderiales bacterium]
MSIPFGALRTRYDRIAISTIDVAFALSVLLHVLALWTWPKELLMRPFDDPREGKPGGALAVRLAPTPPPRPAPSTEAPPAPARRLVAPRTASPPPGAPRVLTAERHAKSAPVAPPSPKAAESKSAVLGQDLAAYIEARRRAREPAPAASPAPAVESEQQRASREAAERLGLNRTPTFGSNKILGGGTFQVRTIGIERAELVFYGWNKDINRVSLQSFEVPRGSHPSTQIAVVRKIIEIIREQESGNFLWESLRLRRELTLSARPADNASLEAFLMEEFFSAGRLR